MRLGFNDRIEGIAKPVGEELLRVHKNYQPLLGSLPEGVVKGLAHITGGGLIDNLPRVLPANCDAVIDTKSWKVPALFQAIQSGGKVDREEMYQVFNMGIGMAIVVSAKDQAAVLAATRGRVIGKIQPGSGVVQLAF